MQFIWIPVSSYDSRLATNYEVAGKVLMVIYKSNCSKLINDAYTLTLKIDKRSKCQNDNESTTLAPCSQSPSPEMLIQHQDKYEVPCSTYSITQPAGIFCMEFKDPQPYTDKGKEQIIVFNFNFYNLLKCSQTDSFHLLLISVENVDMSNIHILWNNITKPTLTWSPGRIKWVTTIKILLILHADKQDINLDELLSKQNIIEEVKQLYTTKTPKYCPPGLAYVKIMPHMEEESQFSIFRTGAYFKENEHDPRTVFFTQTSQYQVHYESFTSWTDAKMTCKQRYNMTLLTINTDMEAKLVSQYLHVASLQPVCPVLFLDMQVSNKVKEDMAGADPG